MIGIAGGTGSGKTTFAHKLISVLPADAACLVQHDWYYRDRSHLDARARALVNFDEPDALENDLLARDLLALKQGRSVSCPQYDFASHTRSKRGVAVRAAKIVIVEGILLFAVPELRDIFDVRLFVEAPDDVRLMRRIKRDLRERGRDIDSIEAQYSGSVRAMHDRHVAPSRQCAHLVIPGEGENTAAVEVIVAGLLRISGTADASPGPERGHS